MSEVDGPVMVGVDESAASAGALWWAVREARIHDRRLMVVHALSVTEAEPARAREVAYAAGIRARKLAAGLTVDVVLDDEYSAGRALCRRSRTASLLVVASRGLGGFHGLLVGSVSSYVATHAACPILVVHNGQDWAGPDVMEFSSLPVVVGVGPFGTSAGRYEPVVRFAIDEARLRGVDLVALRAWDPASSLPSRDGRGSVTGAAEFETAERAELATALHRGRQRHPDVVVRQRLCPGGAAAELVDAARRAQMVVVGAHNRRMPGLALGSVTQQVLHHASCAVAVVPAD